MVKEPITKSDKDLKEWLRGTGTAASDIRNFNWSQTILGPRNQWPRDLRILLNAMLAIPYPVFILWGQDYILLYNDGFHLLMGDQCSHVLGRPFEHAFPALFQLNQNSCQTVIQSGVSKVVQNQKIPGHDQLFHFSFSPLFLESGDVGGVQVSLLEIKDCLHSENHLLENEQNSRLMIEAVSDYAIFRLTPDGIVDSWNTGAEKIKGYSASEIIGHHFSQFYTEEDNRANIPTEELNVAKAEGRVEAEGWRVRKDGSRFWANVIITAVRSHSGALVGFVKVTRDITERKRLESVLVSEGFVKDILNSLFNHIAVIDSKGEILAVNDSWIKFAKENEQKDMKLVDIGANYIEVCKKALTENEPLAVEALQGIQKVLNGELPQFTLEYPCNSPNEARWFEMTVIRPKLYRSGAIIQHQDITHRKKLEEDLRAAIDLRDEFISIASHELKTPLTSLSMQIQLLTQITLQSEAVINKKIADLGKKAFTSIQVLVRLLGELLDVTRIRVGNVPLNLENMDLREATYKAISSIHEEAVQKGVLIHLNANVPVIGRWDPNRINQILLNLLSNALKFGEGKPVDVTLFVDESTRKACLLVKDNGMGISPDMQHKIFQRFQRAITGEKISGLGLGLYIVKKIVEAHHGTITVESELKKGSLFIVTLPMNISP